MSALGNILGASRAEADENMLAKAFVETADYRALAYTRDFNHVVGRRGTGKSALFDRIRAHFTAQRSTFLVTSAPYEHETLVLQNLLREICPDYRNARAILRLTWRLNILLSIFEISRHYKLNRVPEYAYLQTYKESHPELAAKMGAERCASIIREHRSGIQSSSDLPGKIAAKLRIDWVQENVREMLTATGHSGVALWDGLDEGWLPDQASTAIVGGLAAAVADLRDRKVGIHGILFVRDNIFRAFSFRQRFLEAYRRHHNAPALDRTVSPHPSSGRLRVAFDFGDIENDVKVWNRFAGRELQNKTGFETCLKQTLYRPRDLLVLLNGAYVTATRENRDQIIGNDLVATSRGVSADRLNDLFSEYQTVLPELALFVKAFENGPAFFAYGSVVELLKVLVRRNDYESSSAGDFAIFNSGPDAFLALYSVGFVGIRDKSVDHYQFCHDGALANVSEIEMERAVVVPPCYWQALNLNSPADESSSLVIEVDDEVEDKFIRPEKAERVAHVKDIRTKHLGQVLEQLPKIELGREGYSEFEDWVNRAVKIIFAGKLGNVEFKPNQGDVQQRDIVATNLSPNGFWRRVLEDYETRHVIIEVKNYTELGRDDFRQMLSYMGGFYGRLGIVIYRSESEGMTVHERAWLQEIWHTQNRLVLTLPVPLIRRCISKLRSIKSMTILKRR